jgi:osmoprotectant transport system ATP-binding protein
MLEVKGVVRSYDGTRALGPVDLAFQRGRTTALIGPSGSGKSTLLRLLIGLLRPDEGRVLFDGEALTAKNVLAIRLRMGYVIQDGGLFPHLTARENVTLMARHAGRDGAWRRARLEELVALTRFPPDALDRYPIQISGGQRQRVSLMRALFLDPDVLLLDEPLAALDPMIRADLQSDLRLIFRDLGKTVVFVSHDIGEAGYLGDTVVLLREGRIVQSGRFEDLVRAPAEPFVTEFVNAQRSPLEDLRGGPA